MLQNAYLLAKIGADTAENEKNFAEILPKICNYPTGRRGPHADLRARERCVLNLPARCRRTRRSAWPAPRRFRGPRARAGAALLFTSADCSVGQTLEGSFSVVSMRNFASKYAFETWPRPSHVFAYSIRDYFLIQI